MLPSLSRLSLRAGSTQSLVGDEFGGKRPGDNDGKPDGKRPKQGDLEFGDAEIQLLNRALNTLFAPGTETSARESAQQNALALLGRCVYACQVVHNDDANMVVSGFAYAEAVAECAIAAGVDKRTNQQGFLEATTFLALAANPTGLLSGAYNAGFTLGQSVYPLFDANIFVRTTKEQRRRGKPVACKDQAKELFYTLYSARVGLGPKVFAAWVQKTRPRFNDAPLGDQYISYAYHWTQWLFNKVASTFFPLEGWRDAASVEGRKAAAKAVAHLVSPNACTPMEDVQAQRHLDVLKHHLGRQYTDLCGKGDDLNWEAPCSLTVIMEAYTSDGTNAALYASARSFGEQMGRLAIKIAENNLWLADLKFKNLVVKLKAAEVTDARAIDLDPDMSLLAFPELAERLSTQTVSKYFHALVLLLEYIQVTAKPSTLVNGSAKARAATDFFHGLLYGLGFTDPANGKDAIEEALRDSNLQTVLESTTATSDEIKGWFEPQTFAFYNGYYSENYSSTYGEPAFFDAGILLRGWPGRSDLGHFSQRVFGIYEKVGRK